MQIIGNYTLNLQFGGNIINVTPQMIEELTITQDIERILPTFKMVLKDATKLLTDVAPFDKNVNKIQIEFSRSPKLDNLNTMEFAVKRRNTASPDEVYSIEGVLDIPEIVTENRNTYFTGNLKTSIETIAKNLGIANTEVGSSLSYDKTILQPNWTDAKLLRYLKSNISGKNTEGGFQCFIKVVNGKKIFVFKSLNEILTSPIKYKFIVAPKAHQDFYPISDYRIFDNSQLIADLGAKLQNYEYFNYATGQYIQSSISIQDCPTLSEFVLIDDDRVNDSVLYTKTGRSNEFTSNFDGRIRNGFYDRANEFIYMWASTWGLENIAPGDVVQVVFGEAFQRGNLFIYQHSGLWLVKRVVHVIGDSFITNLMLTRSGIDTDINTTLFKSENRLR